MNTHGELLSAILNENTPVFLASGDGESRLTLHVADTCDLAALKWRIDEAQGRGVSKMRVSVRKHQPRRLAFPRSLEHWLRQFSADQTVYDPTLIVERARALVSTAKICRSAFGQAIKSVLFDPASRNLFFVVRHPGAINLEQLQAQIEPATKTGCLSKDMPDSAANDRWLGAIRIVTAPPKQKLVPVDARSAGILSNVARIARRWRGSILLAAAFSALAGLPAAANTNVGQTFMSRASLEPTTTSRSIPATDEYGLLPALSVFADGPASQSSEAFVSKGLRVYFGNMKLAQNDKKRRRRREPEEIGQIGAGS
jgi:hypothetical protein